MTDVISAQFSENGLIVGFCFSAVLLLVANWISKLVGKRIHHSAIAIGLGLILAGIGGVVTHGSKGLADITVFSGLSLFGGSMMRDFAIVSTAYGVRLENIKKCGAIGIASLFIGLVLAFVSGLSAALIFGYTDPADLTTIGAGVVSFIVGPITGGALGVDSAVMAISIAAGLVKSILTMIITPFFAKSLGLTTPRAAIVFGGLIGTTSGVSTALAAIDQDLVPYGAMTCTFHTGLGCLICPTVFYAIVNFLF